MGNKSRGGMGNCVSCVAKVDVSHTGCVHMHSALNYGCCRGNHSRCGNSSRGNYSWGNSSRGNDGRGGKSRGSSKSCVSSTSKVDMAVPCSVNMDSRVTCYECRGLGQDLSHWLDKCRGCVDSGMGGAQVDMVLVQSGRG